MFLRKLDKKTQKKKKKDDPSPNEILLGLGRIVFFFLQNHIKTGCMETFGFRKNDKFFILPSKTSQVATHFEPDEIRKSKIMLSQKSLESECFLISERPKNKKSSAVL